MLIGAAGPSYYSHTRRGHTPQNEGKSRMRLKRILATLGAAIVAAFGVTTVVSPAAYASTTVGGSLACVSGNYVEGIWIDADSGTDGFATLSPAGGTASAVSWTRTLTSGTGYHIHAGCGGSPSNWAVLVYSGHRTGSSGSVLCYDIAYEAPYGTCS